MPPGQIFSFARRRGRRALTRRGSITTEFALVLPLYLAAIVGVIETGWQLTVAATLDRATMQASRFGITGQAILPGDRLACRSETIPALIVRASGDILQPERLTVTLGAAPSASRLGQPPLPGPGLAGQIATYSVAYTQPFASLAWLQPFGVPAQLVHRTTVVVKNETFDNVVC